MDNATGIGSADAPVKTEDGAGNPAGGNGGGANGSGAASGTTSSGPDKGELDWVKAKGWVNEDGSYKTADVLKSYQSLEKQFGSMVKLPDDKASQEDRDAFAKRMGWPGDVSKYEFKPDNLPADIPYDEKLASEFKNWANDLRLPAKETSALHDKFVTFRAEQHKADVAAFEAHVNGLAPKAHEQIVKDWGDTGSETYKANQEAARRAASDPKLKGFVDELKQAGLMTKDGNFTSANLANIMASHGKQFMNDRFISPNGQSDSGKNPFGRTLATGAPNPDYNLTHQNSLMQQNPELARAKILAAGHNPADYGMT